MRNQNANLMSAALVLFSGGQDSTTCLYWAKKNFDEVFALGFDYGQKHVVEITQATKIAHLAKVPYSVIPLKNVLSGSALTEHEKDMNEKHDIAEDLPASFVPGRNALFLTLAAGFAYNRGITNLVGGMCQTDYSGYPDCRKVFIDAQQVSLSLAMEADFVIHTPLMYLNKAETWKLAKDLGILEVIIDHSHTDYNGDRSVKNEWGYGKLDNPASVLRAKGYEEAKKKGWI
jgi:7-cyano-7-deazaguanine synthase